MSRVIIIRFHIGFDLVICMNDLHRFVHEHNADSDSDGFDDSVVLSLHGHTNHRLSMH
jgi:hypothetical protein